MSRLLSNWTHRIASRYRHHLGDRGAGFVEYAGLLLLVAAIVATVIAANIDNQIATGIGTIVGRVMNGGG
ncbi:hypothetical protein RM780_25920 [Streptomyces sp. DSM 44917]|uniref:Flp family type IVb pilin n=1 Tax=Streptomyces boetiae TaxID=3075541 RepID=A0ABU2LFJ5_9ACTN|nr:hypothetical protein [Streptomyces sp. DSM 44917]MDT0310360.1 hypothetical protein [Streptomyces sp. DSM 44917]